MTTETQEQQTAAPETAQQTSTEKEVTLDDVYRDAGLDKVVAQEVQQAPKQETKEETPAVEPSRIPDPYDTENHKAYLAAQEARAAQIQKGLTEVAKFLTTQQQEAANRQAKADLETSVKAIDEIAQIGKPDVLQRYLVGMLITDQKLKAIWDARAKNPAAWNNAVKVVGKQVANELSMKVDPELQKAQRARKESQQQMATSPEESPNSEWENLSPEEHQRKWEAVRNQWG